MVRTRIHHDQLYLGPYCISLSVVPHAIIITHIVTQNPIMGHFPFKPRSYKNILAVPSEFVFYWRAKHTYLYSRFNAGI